MGSHASRRLRNRQSGEVSEFPLGRQRVPESVQYFLSGCREEQKQDQNEEEHECGDGLGKKKLKRFIVVVKHDYKFQLIINWKKQLKYSPKQQDS